MIKIKHPKKKHGELYVLLISKCQEVRCKAGSSLDFVIYNIGKRAVTELEES